jgi:hypothetical protein
MESIRVTELNVTIYTSVPVRWSGETPSTKHVVYQTITARWPPNLNVLGWEGVGAIMMMNAILKMEVW